VKLDLTPETRSDVVHAFLKVGVPPTAVARALGMDPDHVKGVLSHIRVERYGTDELPEAMAWLQWEAYEEALNQIRVGTPASRARFVQIVLARGIGLAGKSNPETAEKVRAALEEFAQAAAPAVRLQSSIYEATE
jgi:hypothetical protein